MKETWRYYDFLRRWGLLLLLGLVVGAIAGLGFYLQQDQEPLFTATASVTLSTKDRPGVWLSRANFIVSSSEFPDPNASVAAIMSNTKWLSAQPGYIVAVEDLAIMSRFRSPLWKAVVLGSFFGGLLAIGAAYLWDDARSYMRNRQETDSEDA